MRQRIRSPKESLQSYISQLERISSAADILREVHRFLHLSRRLELQYPLEQSSGADGTDSKVTAERDLSKAALTLSELRKRTKIVKVSLAVTDDIY